MKLGKQKDSKAVKRVDMPKNVAGRLPIVQTDGESCGFKGYDVDVLMRETSSLRKLITQRGTLEILLPLCCSTDSVRYLKFKKTMKGFSSKTLVIRLKELKKMEFCTGKPLAKFREEWGTNLQPKGRN